MTNTQTFSSFIVGTWTVVCITSGFLLGANSVSSVRPEQIQISAPSAPEPKEKSSIKIYKPTISPLELIDILEAEGWFQNNGRVFAKAFKLNPQFSLEDLISFLDANDYITIRGEIFCKGLLPMPLRTE